MGAAAVIRGVANYLLTMIEPLALADRPMHGSPQWLPSEGGFSMASFRTIAALSVLAGAVVLAVMPTASAQSLEPIQTAVAPVATVDQAFNRCPQTADQFADVLKQLTSLAARSRALADQNPMLEPDAAFYAAELAAAKTCAPTIATLSH